MEPSQGLSVSPLALQAMDKPQEGNSLAIKYKLMK